MFNFYRVKKTAILRYCILQAIVWAAVLSGFSTIAGATPYQPEGAIRIITRASTSESDPGEGGIEWRVVLEKNQMKPGTALLSFAAADSGQEVCRIAIEAADSASDGASTLNLSWNNADRQPQVIRQTDLLIVPGSPVPCDILPVDMVMGNKDPKNYEIRRQVGGQTFVDNFKVTCADIDAASARTNGWLTGGELPGNLVMVTVVNARTNALVVRQLWASGADWWIFEETPYHQSRQVR